MATTSSDSVQPLAQDEFNGLARDSQFPSRGPRSTDAAVEGMTHLSNAAEAFTSTLRVLQMTNTEIVHRLKLEINESRQYMHMVMKKAEEQKSLSELMPGELQELQQCLETVTRNVVQLEADVKAVWNTITNMATDNARKWEELHAQVQQSETRQVHFADNLRTTISTMQDRCIADKMDAIYEEVCSRLLADETWRRRLMLTGFAPDTLIPSQNESAPPAYDLGDVMDASMRENDDLMEGLSDDASTVFSATSDGSVSSDAHDNAPAALERYADGSMLAEAGGTGAPTAGSSDIDDDFRDTEPLIVNVLAWDGIGLLVDETHAEMVNSGEAHLAMPTAPDHPRPSWFLTVVCCMFIYLLW